MLPARRRSLSQTCGSLPTSSLSCLTMPRRRSHVAVTAARRHRPLRRRHRAQPEQQRRQHEPGRTAGPGGALHLRHPAAGQVVAQGGGAAVGRRQARPAAGRRRAGAPASALPTPSFCSFAILTSRIPGCPWPSINMQPAAPDCCRASRADDASALSRACPPRRPRCLSWSIQMGDPPARCSRWRTLVGRD